MSCMLLTRETHAALADYIAALLNMGREFFGMDAQDQLRKALKDCADGYQFYDEAKIYKRLYRMNRDAYETRYKGNPLALALIESGMPCYFSSRKFERTEYEGGRLGHWIVSPWHYQMFSRLDNYLYHCDEAPVCESELFRALNELRSDFSLFIVRNHADYAHFPIITQEETKG